MSVRDGYMQRPVEGDPQRPEADVEIYREAIRARDELHMPRDKAERVIVKLNLRYYEQEVRAIVREAYKSA